MRSLVHRLRECVVRYWIALVAVLFGLYAFAYLGKPIDTTLSSTTDDAYYYLGYARNLAQGNGPTFDGVVTTNGVQPLWTLMLIALAHLINGDVELLLAARYLSALLSIAAIVLLQRLLSRWCRLEVQLLAVALLLVFLVRPINSMGGMELPLNMMLHLLAAVTIMRLRDDRPASLLICGSIVALTVLARIDNLILTPAYAGLALWRLSTKRNSLSVSESIRAVKWLALPSTVTVIFFASMSWMMFDSPLPISGTAKSTYAAAPDGTSGFTSRMITSLEVTTRSLANLPNHLFGQHWIDPNVWIYPTGALLTGLAIWFTACLARRNETLLNLARLTLLVVVVLHLGAFSFLLPASMVINTRWYYAVELITLLISIAVLWQGLIRASRRHKVTRFIAWAVPLVATVALVVLLVNRASGHLNSQGRSNIITRMAAAAEYCNNHLPTDAVIGAFDSGTFGYFTDARVVNLDGLMNNRELLPYLRLEKPLLSYLHEKNIRWLMHIERRGKAAPAERMLASLDRACLEERYRLGVRKHRKTQLRDLVIYRVVCPAATASGPPPQVEAPRPPGLRRWPAPRRRQLQPLPVRSAVIAQPRPSGDCQTPGSEIITLTPHRASPIRWHREAARARATRRPVSGFPQGAAAGTRADIGPLDDWHAPWSR